MAHLKGLHFVALTAFLFGMSQSQTIHNASDLIDNLLTNYKTVLRPKINQLETMYVNFTMELISVIEFDEVQGNLFLNAFLHLSWIDERLTWNPADYNYTYSVLIESDKIWTPMIVHTNTIEKTEKIGSDDKWQLIRIMQDGQTNYYPGGLLSSSCSADVTYYPLDTHTCSVEFVTWGFISTELQLNSVKTEVQQSYYSPNGVWTLKRSAIESGYGNGQIKVQLTLSRKPRFVIINVILPIVFMTLLNTIVFLIPTESGERISYSITMLLAVAVFLTLVGDNLPKSSSPMSIISYYLLLILTVSVLFGTLNIISLRCYFADEKEKINKHWRNLVKISKLKSPSMCKNKAVHVENEQGKETHVRPLGVLDENIGHTKTHLPSDEKKEFSKYVNRENKEEAEKVSWKDVSLAMDKVSFVFSLAVTFIISIVFFVIIYTGAD